MHLTYRNVNDAFRGITSAIHTGKILTNVLPSRAGEVLVVEEPMTITYREPTERVLLNPARDANPFFHMFEGLWMLAGRNDVEPLTRYNSQIGKIASDDGETFNGAYGYRWREVWLDQLELIADHLHDYPLSRRAVLTMWSPASDLLRIETHKDVCCNTHVYFSIEDEMFLNMTVCNRSNDLVWGCLGANVVHFSMLQEYMASRLGIASGTYNQFTNNLHAYTDKWDPDGWVEEPSTFENEYDNLSPPLPLVKDWYVFDQEVKEFIDNDDWNRRWDEPFLNSVATPMCWAFHLHRRGEKLLASRAIEEVASNDWRRAGREWLARRRTG